MFNFRIEPEFNVKWVKSLCSDCYFFDDLSNYVKIVEIALVLLSYDFLK